MQICFPGRRRVGVEENWRADSPFRSKRDHPHPGASEGQRSRVWRTFWRWWWRRRRRRRSLPPHAAATGRSCSCSRGSCRSEIAPQSVCALKQKKEKRISKNILPRILLTCSLCYNYYYCCIKGCVLFYVTCVSMISLIKPYLVIVSKVCCVNFSPA